MSMKTRIELEVISDNESEGIDLLKLMSENQFVIFKGELRTTGSKDIINRQYNAYVMALIKLVQIDSTLFYNRQEGILKSENGVLVVIDEIDQLAPEGDESPLALSIEYIATKMRYLGISFIFMVQYAKRVRPALFASSKKIFTSKLDDPSNQEALSRGSRGLTKAQLNELIETPVKIQTSVGTSVAKWWEINESNEMTPFIPIFTLSNVKKR